MHHDGCYSFWYALMQALGNAHDAYCLQSCPSFWLIAFLPCRDTEQYALVTSQAISFQDHDLRENAALLVLLRPRQPAWPLVLLANTHLLFNPKRGDIKVQANHAMRWIWLQAGGQECARRVPSTHTRSVCASAIWILAA